MGQTPNFALPYPEDNDPADVPVDMKELAERIDALLAAGIGQPSGAMVPFAGDAGHVPAGWFPCDGRAVSRVDFAALYTAIGTFWGPGNGSTTFNIPDLRQRVPVGQYGAELVGDKGGVWDHKHPAGTLATPDHLHSMQGHQHGYRHSHGVSGNAIGAYEAVLVATSGASQVYVAPHAHHHDVNIASSYAYEGDWTGGPTASHTAGSDRGLGSTGETGPNNQAYALVLYIIKT